MRRLLVALVALALLAVGHVARAPRVQAQVGLGPPMIRGAWTPNSDPGLFTWLRPDLGLPGASNGSAFATWYDQSPWQLTYSQTVGADQYTYVASDSKFNGRPSVASSAYAITMCSQTITQINLPIVIHMAWYTSSVASTQYNAMSVQYGTGTAAGFGQNGGNFFMYSGAVLNSSATISANTPYYTTVVFNGANSYYYVNGTANAVISNVNAGSHYIYNYPMCLGANGTSHSVIGHIAEMIAYSGTYATTTVAIEHVYQYWNALYRTALSLADEQAPDWRLALLDLPRAPVRESLVGWPYSINGNVKRLMVSE